MSNNFIFQDQDEDDVQNFSQYDTNNTTHENSDHTITFIRSSQSTAISGISALSNLTDELATEKNILETFGIEKPAGCLPRIQTKENIVEEFCWVLSRKNGTNKYVCKCCGKMQNTSATRAEGHFTGKISSSQGTWSKCEKFDHEIVQAIKKRIENKQMAKRDRENKKWGSECSTLTSTKRIKTSQPSIDVAINNMPAPSKFENQNLKI